MQYFPVFLSTLLSIDLQYAHKVLSNLIVYWLIEVDKTSWTNNILYISRAYIIYESKQLYIIVIARGFFFLSWFGGFFERPNDFRGFFYLFLSLNGSFSVTRSPVTLCF